MRRFLLVLLPLSLLIAGCKGLGGGSAGTALKRMPGVEPQPGWTKVERDDYGFSVCIPPGYEWEDAGQLYAYEPSFGGNGNDLLGGMFKSSAKSNAKKDSKGFMASGSEQGGFTMIFFLRESRSSAVDAEAEMEELADAYRGNPYLTGEVKTKKVSLAIGDAYRLTYNFGGAVFGDANLTFSEKTYVLADGKDLYTVMFFAMADGNLKTEDIMQTLRVK